MFNVATGGRDTGRELVRHQIPAMVSITGSVRAGIEVAANGRACGARAPRPGLTNRCGGIRVLMAMTTKLGRAGTGAVACAAAALLAAACGSASAGPAASLPGGSGASAAATSSSGASPRTLPGGSLSASPPRSSAPASSCPSARSVTLDTAMAPQSVPALASIEFASASRGWAVGDGRILATSDGGASWHAQYSGPERFFQVDFTDTAHGWAVGTDGLMTTSDGGQTWTGLPEPCGLVDSVHFVTPSVGYAISGGAQIRIDGGVPVPTSGGVLLKTTDGGQSWNAVAGAPAPARSACFASAADGFLGTPGKIWRSANGGASWTASFTEPARTGGQQEPGDTPALQCAGPDAAWADFLGSGAAMSHAPYVAFATEDGSRWHALFEESYIESAVMPSVHAPDGPGTYPGPFSAISPDEAMFLGWDPPVGLGAVPLVRVTGGSLARVGDVGGLTEAYSAAFISPARGWVVGTDQTVAGKYGPGVIESTTNGGHTWTRQYTTGSSA